MRVAFVTNRPAYYRVLVFERLARRWDIDFFFTANDLGRYWTNAHPSGVGSLTNATTGISALGLRRELRRGRYDCIISSLGGRSHLAATAAVVRDRTVASSSGSGCGTTRRRARTGLRAHSFAG